jgi:hypothetical protein
LDELNFLMVINLVALSEILVLDGCWVKTLLNVTLMPEAVMMLLGFTSSL